MPIKNLTNRGLAFPEIGQIRKGAAKPERGPGKDLTYFRVEFDEREEEAAAIFQRIYGKEPREINILFPFNDIEQVFDAYLEAYTAGRMVARSDGEKFLYLIDTNTGEIKVKNGTPFMAYRDDMTVGTYKDGNGKTQDIRCTPVGRLKVVIPELQRLAYMTVMTTSKHDIANLDAQIRALKDINNGQIAGIPMILRRRPKKISTPKPDGTRARYTKWMLSIEADHNWVKAKLLDYKHLALPGNGLDLLESGDQEEPIEVEFLQINSTTPDEVMDTDMDEEEFDAPSEPEEIEEPDQKSRPYAPATVKEGIANLANGKYADKKASQEQKNLVIGMLDACFAGIGDSEQRRHAVTKYLTGAASSKKLTDPQILALLEWLKPEKDSGGAYQPNKMSEKEAGSIYAFASKENGQQQLI